VTGLPQNAVQLRCDRALAVCAANMNDRIRAVGIAAVRQQSLRSLEPPPDATRETREQLVEQIGVSQDRHVVSYPASFGDGDGGGDRTTELLPAFVSASVSVSE
jgi:hypothetical protein